VQTTSHFWLAPTLRTVQYNSGIWMNSIDTITCDKWC